MVGALLGRHRVVCDHFVDVNKMIDLNLNGHRSARWMQGVCCLSGPQLLNSTAIDPIALTGYRNRHIRPMAVRPLDHPEREPTPWGFLFSGPGNTRAVPSQWRSP